MTTARGLDVAQAAPSSAVLIDFKSRRRTTLKGKTDPHLAWERQLDVLRAVTADKEAGPLDDELYAIEERIAETPARTMAGVLVQLRLARLAVLDEVWDGSGEAALLNAVATLERLGAGRALA